MSDLFLLFGNFDDLLTAEGRQLGARMRAYWKNFATNHTLGPAPAGGWPGYGGPGARNYLALDVPQDSPAAQWKRAQCDFIDSILN